MLSRLLAATIMIIFMPFFILIGLVLLISDGLPILFKQKRLGRNNIEFTMYKFRTMKNHAPKNVATRFLKLLSHKGSLTFLNSIAWLRRTL